MSDTPRTNAKLLTVAQRTDKNYLPEMVYADVSRAIERDLSAANATIADLLAQLCAPDNCKVADQYKADLSAARKALESLMKSCAIDGYACFHHRAHGKPCNVENCPIINAEDAEEGGAG